MTQTIVRMYPTKEAATAAVDQLKAAGFSLYDIHVVHPPAEPGADPAGLETLAAQIERGRTSRAHARTYARGVQAGGTLVTVNAPFGMARLATGILKEHEPIDSGVPDPETRPLPQWDDAAPLSSAMMWPVLLRDDPTPFSDALGVEVLTKDRASFSQAVGVPELSSRAAPLSDAVHVPVLSGQAAPFSRMIAAPTLSATAAPFSDALKLPVLTPPGPEYPAVFKKRMLIDEPAPLSKWLGLPVLWRRR